MKARLRIVTGLAWRESRAARDWRAFWIAVAVCAVVFGWTTLLDWLLRII